MRGAKLKKHFGAAKPSPFAPKGESASYPTDKKAAPAVKGGKLSAMLSGLMK